MMMHGLANFKLKNQISSKLQRLVSRRMAVYYIKKKPALEKENFSNQNVKEKSFIKF